MRTVIRQCSLPVIVFSIFIIAASLTLSGRIGSVVPSYGSEWANLSASSEEKGLRAVAVDPLNPQKLFICSEKGVFMSTDAGREWTNMLDLSVAKMTITPDISLTKKKIVDSVKVPGEKDVISGATALAIDPANSQKITAGSVDGLYISEDGGKNWEKAGGSLEGLSLFVLSLAIDPSNPDVIYAGTFNDALLKSSDGGTTWGKVMTWEKVEGEPGRDSVTSVAVNPFDSNVVYVGTADAVFKTNDGCSTWNKIEPEVKIAESIAIDQVYPEVIYMGTSSGLYKSNDGGESWMGIGQDVFGGKQVREVAVAPSDSSAVYVATAGGVYGSADKGITWQDLSKGTGLKGAMALAFDPLDSSVIWVATAGGLYKTAISKTGEVTPPSTVTTGVAMAEEAPAEEAPAEEVVPEMTIPGEEEVETIALDDDPFAAEAKAGEEEAAPEEPSIPTIDDVNTILGQFAHEPTVQEVQEVAMRFAEVHPDLIEGWRKGAKWRALLPEFTIDYEYDRRNFSRDDHARDEERETELGSQIDSRVEDSPNTGVTLFYDTVYTEMTSYKVTTEEAYRHEERRDNNIAFEFEWEFGDFLYNPDQVRISDEARDLVELRNDVLEEVTQFYFQRRQLQIDLLLQPPEDLRERLRMELQLQEVTANVDYLTGGYLTQRLNDFKQGKTRKSNIFKRLFNI